MPWAAYIYPVASRLAANTLVAGCFAGGLLLSILADSNRHRRGETAAAVMIKTSLASKSFESLGRFHSRFALDAVSELVSSAILFQSAERRSSRCA